MSRRTRWIALGLVGALAVSIAAAIPALPSLVRAVAVARLQAMTGRPVTIDSLDLSLRKGELSVRGVRLADRDGSTLATIGRLDARIRLRALFAGHVSLRDLAIEDSTVHVVRFSHNEFNISDLIRRKAGGTALDVTVDRFALARGTVLLEDRSVTPWRTWKSDDLTIEARNVSTRRGDGEADARSTIDGAPVSVHVDHLRLVPVHLRAVVRAQQVDVALARIYLPADTPIVLDRGRLDTTVTVTLDARTGVRADVDGRIAEVRLVRRFGGETVLEAPALRLAVRDFAASEGGAAVGRVELAGATTLVNPDASPPARFELGRISLAAEKLSWPVGGPARIELASTVPGGGDLVVRGSVKAQPAAAVLDVRLSRVNLAPWGRYAAPWLRVTGTAEAALTVEAALGPTLTATGKGTARATAVAVSDGKRRLLSLEQAEVSGLEAEWPSRVTLGRVQLRRPSAVVERDATGAILVPGMTAPAAPPPDAAPSEAPDLAPPPAPPSQLTVAIGELGIEDGTVTWHDVSVKPEATVRLARVRLVAKDAAWPLSAPVAVDLSAATPGGGTVQVKGKVGMQPMTADVQVRARGVALEPYRAYLPVAVAVSGAADAAVSATLARDPDLKAQVRGTAALSRVAVTDGKRRVLSAERVEARGLDVDWPGRLTAARLTVRRPWVLVERDEQGGFPLRSMLLPAGAAASLPPNGASPAPPNEAAPARTIAIGELAIEDGGARVVDRAVSPPYAEDISRLWFRARGIASASEKPARVDARATIGPAALVTVRGTVGALDGPLTVNLSGEVRDLPVLRLNPYLQHFVGWNARQGKVSTTIACRVTGGDLAADTKIRVARLEVVRATPEDVARQRIGLPLGLIVALMKNARGEITLSLPIGGRLDDPRFEVREAIWGAARAVAIHAIALPVSWIGRLRFSQDSKIQDVEIDPLEFESGTATIGAASAPQAERLAEFMRRLPDVRIIMTPVVSLGDIEALKTRAITARIAARAAEKKISEAEAARQVFAQQFPGHEPPSELADIVAALREVEEPSASDAAALAKERAETVRNGLEKADIDTDRIAINKEAGALETFAPGRVEFGLTDQLKPRRTLADLLRALIEAVRRRLSAAGGRG